MNHYTKARIIRESNTIPGRDMELSGPLLGLVNGCIILILFFTIAFGTKLIVSQIDKHVDALEARTAEIQSVK